MASETREWEIIRSLLKGQQIRFKPFNKETSNYTKEEYNRTFCPAETMKFINWGFGKNVQELAVWIKKDGEAQSIKVSIEEFCKNLYSIYAEKVLYNERLLAEREEKIIKISDFVGETFHKVMVSRDKTELSFVKDSGDRFLMYHEQDCCESVYLDDITGDLEDLEGSEILVAYESSSNDCGTVTENNLEDSYTWTFYHLATQKGWVTLRWYGESNGYYSESIDIKEIKQKDLSS